MKWEDEQRVRKAILRTLTNYPKISSAMLGLHVRPYTPDWTMVLNAMVDEGVVHRETVNDSHPGYAYSLTRPVG